MDRLWHTFHHDPDAAKRDRARARLIESHQHQALQTVHACCGGRQLGPHIDRGDLEGAALYGLVKAVDLFEPERGIQFNTFAIAKMRGAILEHMRIMDWVTRSARAKIHEGYAARAIIEEFPPGKLVPVNVEDAAHVHELMRVGLTDHAASAQHGSGLTVGDLIPDPSPGPEDVAAGHVEIEALMKRVRNLPPREEMIIRLYYGNEMTLLQIARKMGISESRVYQMRGRALERLAQLMG
jgi:RNA polymerase sigma factor for flagellar operon FliA